MSKVYIYCRKSSESDEKQVQSLDSQEEEMMIVAKKLNIKVDKILEESKSAKVPGRPVFNNIMDDIASGECHTVLVWHPDRLSRNATDLGTIIDLVDKGKLIQVITPQQTFRNIPIDKFMLAFQMLQAKLENDNKGINAKRGMMTKAKLGWYPTHAPIGYLNTPNKKKGFKTIINDSERFDLVKRIWREVLKGRLPANVWREASNDWKLTNSKGKSISRSGFYHMLSNNMYCGRFEWPKKSGQWFDGKHEPMVTIEEFNQVQKILGSKGRPCPQKHDHKYNGVIKCDHCGLTITPDRQEKLYKTTGTVQVFTYWRCTKRKDKTCEQKRVTEADLEKQINTIIDSVSLSDDFFIWSKKWLKALHKIEIGDRKEITKSHRRMYDKIQTRLDRLLDAKLDADISDKVYRLKKNELSSDLAEIKERLERAEKQSKDWCTQAENAIDFAKTLKARFIKATPDIKKQLLFSFGTNFALNNGILRIQLDKTLKSFENEAEWEAKYPDSYEPSKKIDVKGEMLDLIPANPTWLPR